MKKLFGLILITILGFGLTACELEFEFGNNKSKQDVETINEIEYLKYENELYDEFFNVESVISINIDINESELALIQSDYEYYNSFGSKSPIYRKANVTITVNDKEYYFEEVGIRMKGNTSRRNFYNSTEGIYDLIHYKLSFVETFDSFQYENPMEWTSEAKILREERLFAGMEKLDLKWNKSLDATYSREAWSYYMFEEFNVLAPKITPVNVLINYDGNNNNLGIFFAIEMIDEKFFEKRLSEKHLGGDLYKVGWTHMGGDLTLRTLDSIGIEDENNSYFYVYDLKTNKKTSDHLLLNNLIHTLNSENDLSNVVNIPYYLNFEAISYLTGNPDDMRNNFNNYYIYFLADSKKAIFIPYDYDRSLGITHEWDPTGNAMTSFSPYTNRTSVDSGNSNAQINPLITKTIARGGNLDLILKYRSIVLEGLNSKYFDIDEFIKVYEIHKNKYQNQTKPSIIRLHDRYIDFNETSSYNMPVSEYLNKKSETANNLIDSYQ